MRRASARLPWVRFVCVCEQGAMGAVCQPVGCRGAAARGGAQRGLCAGSLPAAAPAHTWLPALLLLQTTTCSPGALLQHEGAPPACSLLPPCRRHQAALAGPAALRCPLGLRSRRSRCGPAEPCPVSRAGIGTGAHAHLRAVYTCYHLLPLVRPPTCVCSPGGHPARVHPAQDAGGPPGAQGHRAAGVRALRAWRRAAGGRAGGPAS